MSERGNGKPMGFGQLALCASLRTRMAGELASSQFDIVGAVDGEQFGVAWNVARQIAGLAARWYLAERGIFTADGRGVVGALRSLGNTGTSVAEAYADLMRENPISGADVEDFVEACLRLVKLTGMTSAEEFHDSHGNYIYFSLAEECRIVLRELGIDDESLAPLLDASATSEDELVEHLVGGGEGGHVERLGLG
jgi:hypothetical protein